VLKEAKYVDKGISGSPALNTQSNKVIGIFTEQELKTEQLYELGLTTIMDKSALVTPIDEIAKELSQRPIKDNDLSEFINMILFATPKLLQDAKDALKSCDFDTAKKLCEETLKNEPDHPYAHLLLAISIMNGKGADQHLQSTIENVEGHLKKVIANPSLAGTTWAIWGIIRYDYYINQNIAMNNPPAFKIVKENLYKEHSSCDISLVKMVKSNNYTYQVLGLNNLEVSNV
jgi:hypothetical protein